MTYLIAIRAGFDTDTALKIAYSSQYIDDNTRKFNIFKDKKKVYSNYISQTKNIFKPQKKLLRIYPVFHFIPGNPQALSAIRKDGKMHTMCCTPNSENSLNIFSTALKSGDPYRIGIATHSYADTWAHQNFTGILDSFNGMSDNILKRLLPDIGHANALHSPDEAGKIWYDSRMAEPKVNNKNRFLAASGCIFLEFAELNKLKNINKKKNSLLVDFDKIIVIDNDNNYQKERIKAYQKLALTPEYGGTPLPDYDKDQWFKQAVSTKQKWFKDINLPFGVTLFPDKHSPKNGFYESDWYCFQESIKKHQRNVLKYFDTTDIQYIKIRNF